MASFLMVYDIAYFRKGLYDILIIKRYKPRHLSAPIPQG